MNENSDIFIVAGKERKEFMNVPNNSFVSPATEANAEKAGYLGYWGNRVGSYSNFEHTCRI